MTYETDMPHEIGYHDVPDEEGFTIAEEQIPRHKERIEEPVEEPAPVELPKSVKPLEWLGAYAVCKDCRYGVEDRCGGGTGDRLQVGCKSPYMIGAYATRVPYHERIPASTSHILVSPRMVENCPIYKSKGLEESKKA